ncbi:hypothetical protein [Larkinella rosea]|uniref:Glycosyltransferase RgtA/B/C/D-like domain-containing protein n=1 Tax=Larkinella rosea TaxID=2025312 RepID=A0A3P1BUR1_9BACT|nr:hypothetical protein [Larkinella rosea]RRB04848.1 hypothetical protein EHT25_15415 [Larkinella rosea]
MIQVSAWLRRISPVLVAFPMVCFLALVLIFADNIPWMDDLQAFIEFLIEYTAADSFAEKLHWLLVPNNEHRIVFAKLTTVFFYKLTGTLNFRWLILVGFGCLLALLLVLFRIFRTLYLPLLAFLPVTFVLFQPQYRLTSFWAITALQHQVVPMLALWAIYLLANANRPTVFSVRFFGAIGLQLLVSFSNSNGLFGWVAGAAVLLVQWRLEGTNFLWRLVIWIGLGVLAILFYFHDFANLQGNESSLSFLLKNPHLVFFAFFTFLGGLFDFFPTQGIVVRSILPTAAGMTLVAILFGLFKTTLLPSLWQRNRKPVDLKLNHRRYFFVGAYVFLLVNAVVIAVLRPRFGYDVMLISNYMIYPALFVILLYLNLLSETRNPERRKQWMMGGIGLGALVWVVMYFYHLPPLGAQKLIRQTSVFNQKHNDLGFGAIIGSAYAKAISQWMHMSTQKGFYSYPENTFYAPYEQTLLKPVPPADSSFHLLVQESADEFRVITNDWPLPAGIDDACIIVKSDQHTYLFPAENLFFPVQYYLKRRMPNVSARVLKSFLYPGTYQLGLLIVPNGKADIRFSNQFLNVR